MSHAWQAPAEGKSLMRTTQGLLRGLAPGTCNRCQLAAQTGDRLYLSREVRANGWTRTTIVCVHCLWRDEDFTISVKFNAHHRDEA